MTAAKALTRLGVDAAKRPAGRASSTCSAFDFKLSTI